MHDVAIIGAGGFVGSAFAESLILDGAKHVRVVVRAYRSLASLARFGSSVTVQLADAENCEALAHAIRGCSAVVNLTTGAPRGIVCSTLAVLNACVRERVKRLVHLSSAVVFGEARQPNLADDSRPPRRHWMPYARAKAKSEVILHDCLQSSPVEIVVLRPGIVWGPRSPHTLDIVHSLLEKRAFLVDGGSGVFNAIYIQNLIASMRAVLDHRQDPRGFYNIADGEDVTWYDFYAGLAPHLGYDMSRIPAISSRAFPWSIPSAIEYLQALPFINAMYHTLKVRLPSNLKARLKSFASGAVRYDTAAAQYSEYPCVNRELWHLQRTCHKLPTDKFAARFGYHPPVTFAEGIRRTIKWLSHIGLITHPECYAV